jgi:hypothetical protein
MEKGEDDKGSDWLAVRKKRKGEPQVLSKNMPEAKGRRGRNR